MWIPVCLAKFSLEWEMFQARVLDKKDNSLSSDFFFWKSRRVWNNVEECGTAGQATDDNQAHAHCMLHN